ALARVERVGLRHGGCGQAQDVEGASQKDVDCAAERIEAVGLVLARERPSASTWSTVADDGDADRAELTGAVDCLGDAGLIGHVGLEECGVCAEFGDELLG